MNEQNDKQNLSSTFSLRKIKLSQDNENNIDTEDNKYTDKIKILELSNLIDSWEQELLFSENGFFSLKGIEAQNKSKDFIRELEKFINAKIDEISFITENAKNTAKKLKQLKIKIIKQQISDYCAKELYEWETEVYNNSLEGAKKKAVTYKNNPEIVQKELTRALNIMKMIADKEQWNGKIFSSKKQSYISDFYYSIITSFLEEKNIAFLHWYNTCKDKLKEDKLNELEKITEEMKQCIIAYNWAIELFSYNLSNTENEAEIKKINDKKLETEVRKYMELLNKFKKVKEEAEEQQRTEQCWNDILSFLETEPAKALLYVDKEQNESIKKAQREYIEKITENGFIETDKSKYIELFEELLEKPNSYLKKSLSEFKHLLSDKDYIFFEQIQKDFEEKYFKIFPDYKFLFDNFKKQNIKSAEEKYNIILSFKNALEEYEIINSKPADIEKRNKIISALFERFTKQ